MKGKRLLGGAGAFCAALTVFCRAQAIADALIYVRANGCSPSSVSINVGQTAYFIVADDNAPYCIQSTIGAWTPWYLWEEGDSFGLQFNERGDYYYREIFAAARA